MLTARFSLNALRSVAIGGLAILPALVVPAVLVRALPGVEAAAWLYALSIATYIGHMHMGIGPACATLTARKTDPYLHVGALLTVSFISLIVVAIATCLLLLGLNGFDVFAAPATQQIGENWHAVFTLAAVSAACLLPLHAVAGHFQGVFRVDRIIPINVTRHLLTTILCCAAALLFHSALAVAIAFCIASAVTLVFSLSIVKGAVSAFEPCDGATTKRQLGPLFKLAVPAALSGLAQIPLIGLHTVLVAKFVPNAIVVFTVTISVLTLIAGFVWAVLGNLLPELSDRFEDTAAGRRRIGSIVTRGSALLGGGLIAVGIGLVLGLPILLSLVVTGSYAAEFLIPVIGYAVIMVIREINLPKNLALLSIGRQQVSLIPVFLEAAIGLTLAFVLVPRLGIMGLSIAVFISLLLSSAVHLWLLNRVGCLSAADLKRSAVLTYGALFAMAGIGLVATLFGHAQVSIVTAVVGSVLVGIALAALYWFVAIDPASRRQMTDVVAQRLPGRKP